MKFSGFIGAAYTAASKTLDSQRCINLRPEMDRTGKNIISLFGTEGTVLHVSCGTGPIRGMKAAQGNLYVVSGTTLYKVTTSATATSIGNISGTDKVDMDQNTTQLFIAAGSVGYIYTFSSGALVQIADPDFQGAMKVDFLDSYFVILPPYSVAGQSFYITALNDGSSIDALDFASAEGSPDALVTQVVNQREVWLFGETSTEIWWDSGASDFPLERISGGFIQIGCAARDSAVRVNDSVYWLGRNESGDGIIYKSQGYAPIRISTHAIEAAIRSYSTISDAEAFCFQRGGHSYYQITFPGGDETWVYDESTQLWHQRAYMTPATGVQGRHRATCHEFFNGYNLVGDYSNGNIYRLDENAYTDNGDAIKSTRSSTHLYDGKKYFTYSMLQVEFEPGVGNPASANPQAILRYSNDGGFTWSSERFSPLGQVGNYSQRTIWRRLGIGRDRVFEVSITDPVKRVIVDASIEAKEHNG